MKKIYQEHGVPAFFRDYIPLIYIEEKLVAITGLYIDDDFAAASDEEAIQIHWTGANDVYVHADA